MAGDWIKMRVGLTTHPRVMRIAERLIEDPEFLSWAGLRAAPAPSSMSAIRAERHAALRVTRYVTVTALLRFWGYANEHAKGEFLPGVLPEDVDEIVGVPGFAAAMEESEWVEFDPAGGLHMPNFHEHNTSAEARSAGAERQKRYRERKRATSDVTRDVTSRDREEKSREEKKEQKQSSKEDSSTATVVAMNPASPECPHGAIVDLYHEVLPELRQVREWGPDRQKFLRSRWREDPERQSLEWWQEFFGYIRRSDFLMGRTDGRNGPFDCDLEWIVRPSNFRKILEGKYDNRERAA